MSDEGRPLPQRERGATEAGARPAPTSAGPRPLTDDLRQRMQAAVDAERAQTDANRAQARERVTEMLRHPPQRRTAGVPLVPPTASPQDPGDASGSGRRPLPKRKRAAHSDPSDKPGRRGRAGRRGQADRPAGPGVPATSGPNVMVPGVNGASANANNAVSAEPVSPNAAEAPAPELQTRNSLLSADLHPGHPSHPSSMASALGRSLTAGAARATAGHPALAPSAPPAAGAPPIPVPAPGMGPGHPSGPVSAASTTAPPTTTPPTAAPPTAPPRPAAPRRRRGRAGLIAGAATVVAAGAVVAVLLTSGHGAPQPTGSPASGQASPAAQAAAVKWVVRQVNPQTVVACDQSTCAALVAQGYAPSNLRKLTTTSALSGSGVVVVTPAARHLFGSSLATAWAPAALATFGAGNSMVSVRVVVPAADKDAATWEQKARQDQAARKSAEAALARDTKTITFSGPAQADLQAGRIDGRLMEAVADAAGGVGSISIVEFGNVGLGASPEVPLRYADLAASDPAAVMSTPAYVQALRTAMNGGPGPRPDRTELVTLPGGQRVLRVEFLAPSPFGVLTGH
jgi:hypothetical protein